MGADIILAHIWTTKDNDELDWDGAIALIDILTGEDLDPSEEYAVSLEHVVPEDEELEPHIRELVRKDFDEFRQLWNGELMYRDTTICVLGPVTVLISGGMSWGDSPTETYDLLARIPLRVYERAGFLQ